MKLHNDIAEIFGVSQSCGGNFLNEGGVFIATGNGGKMILPPRYGEEGPLLIEWEYGNIDFRSPRADFRRPTENPDPRAIGSWSADTGRGTASSGVRIYITTSYADKRRRQLEDRLRKDQLFLLCRL